MKSLRHFDAEQRRVIVELKRRNLPTESRNHFLRQGRTAHDILLALIINEDVADLPRCNAMGLLLQLQSSGPDIAELQGRDRRPLLDALVKLLMSPRPAVRVCAAGRLGLLLNMQGLGHPNHDWIDRAMIVAALRGTLARGDLPRAPREYVEHVLAKWAPQVHTTERSRRRGMGTH